MAGEAIFAVENVAHRAHAHRAHGLAAIPAVADCVRLRMDGTLHGILLSTSELFHRGNSHASISRFLPSWLARFCCFGDDGSVLSDRPGSFFGAVFGMLSSRIAGL